MAAQGGLAACPRSEFTGTGAGLQAWHLGSNFKRSALPVTASGCHKTYRNRVINFQITYRNPESPQLY